MSLSKGHAALAALLWRQFVAAAADPKAVLPPFLLRELPTQAATRTAATRADWVKQAGAWDTLAERCGATIEHMRNNRLWQGMLAWCGLSDQLATAAGDIGWPLQSWVADQRGDTRVLLGDLNGALTAYRAGMTIAERLAASDRDNAGWQRDLSVSHDRIGDVLQRQGDLNGALAAYRAGMTIRERLAARIATTPAGSATSPSATTGSAICCNGRAI